MTKHSPWRVADVPDTPTSIRRKHGERLDREANRPTCCWPKCQTELRGDAPLCMAHLNLAAKIHKAAANNEEFTWRVTAEVAPTPPPKPQPEGFVYYLRSSGFLKIGWTTDLAKRMKAYPPDSILLAVEPGPRQLETRRHRQFSHHRSHGREWYTLAPTLMHHVESVKAEHGNPDPVAFAAKPVGIPQPRQRQTIGRPARGVRHVSG